MFKNILKTVIALSIGYICFSPGLLTSQQSMHQSIQGRCDAVQNLENISHICDMSILDTYHPLWIPDTLEMEIDSICGRATTSNIRWIGFIAGPGDIQIKIDPLICTPATNQEIGLEVSLFEDCTFSNPLWCSDNSCSYDPIITPAGMLEHFGFYYLCIQGCGGSICEIQFDIICNSESCDIVEIPDVGSIIATYSDTLEFCQGSKNQFELEGYDPYMFNEFRWVIYKDDIQVEAYKIDSNSIEITMDSVGEFRMELDVNNTCFWVHEEIVYSVYEYAPDTIVFELLACENDTISQILNETDSSINIWLQEFVVPEHVPNSDNLFLYSEDTYNSEGCPEYHLLELEVLSSQNVLYDTISTSTLPIEYEGFQINHYGLDTFYFDISSQNGCDSLVILNIIMTTSSPYQEINQIEFYPNPCRDYIVIEDFNPINDFVITIYDIGGNQKLRTMNNKRIMLENLSFGLYLIVMQLDGGQKIYSKFYKL